MSTKAINRSNLPQSSTRGVRFPSLTTEQPTAADIDRASDAYKAGFAEGRASIAAESADLAKVQESFARNVEAAMENIDALYRDECLALVKRLFAAIAPTLAKKSTLLDIMALVEERVLGAHAEINLHVHPSMIEHLSDTQRKIFDDNPLMHLHTDENASPASIDAKWARGGLFHDPDSLIAEILGALGETDTPTQEPDQ
ncbi:hypothetical protein [Hyphococcus sp. DH-69]|uniref:hypothetical protein n=1 Tax=Hyphococcus formosus TaxID=3143534 RepID=UPI00398AE8AA